MAMFVIGFICGALVTVVIAFAIVAGWVEEFQRAIGRGLGW